MSIIVALYHQRVTQNWCFECVVFQVFGHFVYETNDSCEDQLDKQKRVEAGSCYLAFLAPDED